MTGDNLSIFSCQHCIAYYRQGTSPVWLAEHDAQQRRQGLPTFCETMQEKGTCAKAILARLAADGQIMIDLVVDGGQAGGQPGRRAPGV